MQILFYSLLLSSFSLALSLSLALCLLESLLNNFSKCVERMGDGSQATCSQTTQKQLWKSLHLAEFPPADGSCCASLPLALTLAIQERQRNGTDSSPLLCIHSQARTFVIFRFSQLLLAVLAVLEVLEVVGCLRASPNSPPNPSVTTCFYAYAILQRNYSVCAEIPTFFWALVLQFLLNF